MSKAQYYCPSISFYSSHLPVITFASSCSRGHDWIRSDCVLPRWILFNIAQRIYKDCTTVWNAEYLSIPFKLLLLTHLGTETYLIFLRLHRSNLIGKLFNFYFHRSFVSLWTFNSSCIIVIFGNDNSPWKWIKKSPKYERVQNWRGDKSTKISSFFSFLFFFIHILYVCKNNFKMA